MRASWRLFIVIGSILLLTRVATADDAPPSREPEKRSSSSKPVEILQEIVVTATRRSEEESKVPISIVALDQAALSTSGIKSISDVANYVPGIQFDATAGFGPTFTNIAIRGVNSIVGTSTTGIYLDDVPIQTRLAVLSFWGNPYPLLFDVDRLEIERGPQGTLFGAGAEGGAIRFISPDPGYKTYTGMAHAELASTRGGDASYEGGVAVGGPIAVDKVGFRFSAWGRKDGGYVDRVDPFTNETVEENSNSTRSYVVRGALGIRPNSAITITPSIFAQGIRYNDSGAYFEYLSNPADNVYKNGRLLQQPATDNFFLPSLKIEGFLSIATITSVTAYFHRWGDLTLDATSFNGAIFGQYVSYGNPPPGPEYPRRYSDAGPSYFKTKVDLFTQEIRASSIDENARLRWTVGAFYSQSSQTDTETVISAFYAVNLFGMPPDEPLLFSQVTSKDTQIAGFAQIDYRITAPVTLTVGGRLSHNVAKFTQAQSGPLASQEFPYASGEQSETPFIPKVGLAYQATRSNLLYLSAAKGYRVGGANQPIPLAPTPGGCPLSEQPPPFDSDSVWSYELGSKNRLFDGRARLDGSVFYVDWRKIQQQIFLNSCAAGFIANTGSAVSKGFDLATEIALTEQVKVGLSVSYIDAYMTKTVTFDGAPIVQAGDAVGSPPWVGSPWNIGGYAEYGFSLLSDRAYVRVEDFYRSENPGPFNTQVPSSPLYAPEIPANPAHNQLSARFGLTHSAMNFELFANNLTNAHPPLYRYQDTVTSTLFTDTTLRPRTIGLTATYRF